MLQAKNGTTNLLLMPFINNGLDQSEIDTSYQLLTNELQKFPEITLKLPSEETVNNNINCSNLDCGVEAGKVENCDETLLVTLSKLGNKRIVQMLLIDVDGAVIVLADNINASAVEDLDMVMKRIALSTSKKKNLKDSAEIGAIVEDEELSHKRRRAAKYVAINFGYLYPQNGYDNDSRSFTMDFTNMYEMGNVDVGLKLAGRYGFSATVFSNYLLTKSDICPYVGGGIGIHFVGHNNTRKGFNEDGFELTASTGLRFFRTYNFEVIANMDYIITLNDYDDQALVFTIGIAMQK